MTRVIEIAVKLNNGHVITVLRQDDGKLMISLRDGGVMPCLDLGEAEELSIALELMTKGYCSKEIAQEIKAQK